MNSIKVSPSSLIRPKINFARLKKPSPLPVRPLPIDRFRPPRGQNEIFLPNFVLTFLHTPTRPPNFASFLVPLWFSKLDLKDYLYNLYSIQALRIRSYVIQQKVREGKPGDRVQIPRQWFRPQAVKKMTVELVTDSDVPGQGPFVWPEQPKDWRPWGKKQFEEARKEQDKVQKRRREEMMGTAWPEDMREVAVKARGLLGRARREEEETKRKKNKAEKAKREAEVDDSVGGAS